MKKSQKSLLEQLYDGELFPPDGISPNLPEYREACGRAEQESSYLMARLSDEDKRHLDELIDITGEMDSYTAYANFAHGFRCGVLLMCELTAGEI